MQFLIGPKGLAISEMNWDHWVTRYFKHLLRFWRKPFSLILCLPILLVLLIAIVTVAFLFVLKVLERAACDHEMILSHSQQQTPLTKIILYNEYLISFNQNQWIISSNWVHYLQDLFLWTFASHQSLMQPLSIVLSRLFVDRRQISSIPNLSIKQKIWAWCLTYIALWSSEVKNGLNSNSISIINF